MYRSQRSGGSMMWMSLSRTRNPLCAMIRLSSRCRGHLTPRAPHDTPPGTVGHRLEAALLILRGDPDGLVFALAEGTSAVGAHGPSHLACRIEDQRLAVTGRREIGRASCREEWKCRWARSDEK